MTEARDEAPPPRPGDAPIEIDPRITWAAERTFLAWIRTGIAFMGFGFVVARFGFFLRELLQQSNAPQTRINATNIGVAMVAFGVVVNVAATLRHRRVVQRLVRGAPIVPETGFPAAVALGSALMGAVEVVLLIAALLR